MNNDWKPWEESDVWKTEASFWSWLRGGLRKNLWTRYPPKNEFKQSRLRPVTQEDFDDGISQRAKKVGDCDCCDGVFPASKLEVDHIEEAGSLGCEDDIAPFIKGLACKKSNMRLVCKPCHEIITLSSRMGVSFDEARIEKEINKVKNLKIGDLRDTLKDRGVVIEDRDKKADLLSKYRTFIIERLSDDSDKE